MAGAVSDRRNSAFSFWLQTGKLPPALGPDGLELKFNPWHDPVDGRFTFAGAGRQDGAGGGDAARMAGRRAQAASGRLYRGKQSHGTASQAVTQPRVAQSPHVASTGHARRSMPHSSSAAHVRRIAGKRSGDRPNPVTEFAGGVGEELYDVGRGTVEGIHAALTTNPVVTVRDASLGIAAKIDAAIAAEDTPARIQLSRAATAVALASARDIGRATGMVAGNTALAATPGAAVSRIAASRRLRMARPRSTFDPPQIGWVKETTKSDKPWKPYNDSVAGSRPGYAPTLMRTMADGSNLPVKFDGVQGDYMIDRKWSVVGRPRARAQILRQSQVPAEHRVIGTWEVPTPVQKVKALKLLKKMNITNIPVKVVKP